MASIIYSQVFDIIVEEMKLVGRDFLLDASFLTIKKLFALISVDHFVWIKIFILFS